MPSVQQTTAIPKPYIAQAMFEFSAQEYIASLIAKPINSTLQSGTILKVTREGLLPQSGEDLKRAHGTAYQRGTAILGSQEFNCVQYGKEQTLDDADMALYTNVWDAELSKSRSIRSDLLDGREQIVAAMVQNTTTFNVGDGNFIDNKAAPWSTAGTDVLSQIGAGIEAARKLTGKRPNALIISSVQLHNLTYTNTAIRGLWSGVTVVTPVEIANKLAALFGLKQVFVGSAVKNTQKMGNDASISDVWSDKYATLATIAETNDAAEHCAFRTLVWSEVADTDVMISTYREEQTDSTVIKGKLYEDHLVVDPLAGYMMQIEA